MTMYTKPINLLFLFLLQVGCVYLVPLSPCFAYVVVPVPFSVISLGVGTGPCFGTPNYVTIPRPKYLAERPPAPLGTVLWLSRGQLGKKSRVPVRPRGRVGRWCSTQRHTGKFCRLMK